MPNINDKFFSKLTELLIDRIKTVSDNWEKPWFEQKNNSPQNIEGRNYNGHNAFMLHLHSDKNGYNLPVYTTFVKAKEQGIKINKGEKSIPILSMGTYYENKETNERIYPKEYDKLSSQEQDRYKEEHTFRISNVWNIDQTDIKQSNANLYQQIENQYEVKKRELSENLNPTIIDKVVANQSWITPIILDQKERAYYSPNTHEIHIPSKEFFTNDERYHSTLLHEMTHSTGKDLERSMNGDFGSPEYAKEELIAELSSAIVGSHYNINKTILDENAQYLKSWLKSLEEQPEFLREILPEVTKASDFMTDKIENGLEVKNSVKEEKEDTSIEPILIAYANPNNLDENAIQALPNIPKDILDIIEDRTGILDKLEKNSSINVEEELLTKKYQLEDNLRERIREYVKEQRQIELPVMPTLEDRINAIKTVQNNITEPWIKESSIITLDKSYRETVLTEELIEDTEENRSIFDAEDVEYEEIYDESTNQAYLKYKSHKKLKEGYTVANNTENKKFLSDNDISFTPIKGNRLFIPAKAAKIGLLLLSIPVAPVIGVAALYFLNQTGLLNRLVEKEHIKKSEAKLLNNGETIRKTITENGSKVDKYFFVDKELNQLRKIPVNEVSIPNRHNGIEFTPSQIDRIRQGETVEIRDNQNGLYYQAKLDLNVKSGISMSYRDPLSEDKEFKIVPKVTSPEEDKIKYIQKAGASGINDIWANGGVNLERDDFLKKYKLEALFKEYRLSDSSTEKERISNDIISSIDETKSIGMKR